jgi:hypothetical protein
VDDVILEFSINAKGRNSTLTFGGRTNPILRKLSAETNVRLFIPGPDSHTNKATLEGAFDDVKRYVSSLNLIDICTCLYYDIPYCYLFYCLYR